MERCASGLPRLRTPKRSVQNRTCHPGAGGWIGRQHLCSCCRGHDGSGGRSWVCVACTGTRRCRQRPAAAPCCSVWVVVVLGCGERTALGPLRSRQLRSRRFCNGLAQTWGGAPVCAAQSPALSQGTPSSAAGLAPSTRAGRNWAPTEHSWRCTCSRPRAHCAATSVSGTACTHAGPVPCVDSPASAYQAIAQ